ncbi:BTAD domain-containing putative transcriptional regulator [Streptomyces sp. NPDC059009]|uniref:AfsR/SARP family transcriptional regulator n=1 Tax=Streptomyces sp. NPDC059009 TaxID=3346694 RepID=UPI0036AFBBDC
MSMAAHAFDATEDSAAKPTVDSEEPRPVAPPLLRVHLLGGFRALRDGGADTATRWSRPGARTLVKLLALAPGHQLHREQIMAVCWPDAELRPALRSLRVALHTARHALEPELAPRAPSSYLVGQGALLRLSEAVWVDADHAEALAERALADGGLPQLAAALDAFTGEVLPEDRYAPWTEPVRERLALLQRRVLLALAEAQLDAAEPESAARAARRALDDSPADERAHRALIEAYLRQGLPHEALRQYEACAAILERDRDARPGPQTVSLHRTALAAARTQAPGPSAPAADPESDAARIRLAWAGDLERAGRYADAAHALQDALSAYERHGDHDHCVLTTARLAEVLCRGATAQQARAALHAHVPTARTPALVTGAHHMARAMVGFYEGAYEEAAAAALRAEESSSAVEGPGGLTLKARALAQQATSLSLAGHFEQSLAPAERALAPAEGSGDPALLANVLSVLRENARRAGRLDAALAHGRRALTLAERAGRPTATAFERANLAELHLLRGEQREAGQLACSAVELAESFGGAALAFALTALARVHATTDPAEAARLLERAEQAARDSGHHQALTEVEQARRELADA